MSKILRSSLAVLALTVASQLPAHADTGISLCIPFVTCVSVGTGSGSGSGSGSGAASAPEISGSMISTGFALVAGAAAMIPRRRRSL